jgi:hypothetical protein
MICITYDAVIDPSDRVIFMMSYDFGTIRRVTIYQVGILSVKIDVPNLVVTRRHIVH